MKKQGGRFNREAFVCKASVLILSSLILQILGFVFRIEINRRTGTQGLAIYQLIMTAYNMVMAFCVQGVTLAAARFSAQRMGLGDLGGVHLTKRIAKRLFCILFFIIAVPTLLFRDFTATYILGDKRTMLGLSLILLCIFLTGFENINKNIFLGTQRVFPTTVSEISELAIRIVGVMVLLGAVQNQSDETAAAMIVVAMIASECSSVCYLAWQYKKTFHEKPPARIKARLLRGQMLKTALPVSLSGLFNKILISANTILIPQMLMLGGLGRAGAMDAFAVMFSMTIPLVVLPSCIIVPVTSVIMPKISENIATEHLKDIRRKAAKMLHLVGLAALPLMCLMFIFAGPASLILYGTERGGAWAGILAFSTVFEYYQIAGGSILNGLGHPNRAAASVVAEGVIQLLFTILLVPVLQMKGYVIGNVVSTIVGALMNLVAVKKYAHVRFRLRNWVLRPLFASILATALSRPVYLLVFHATASVGLSLLCALVLFCAAYLAALRLLGTHVVQYFRQTLELPEKK